MKTHLKPETRDVIIRMIRSAGSVEKIAEIIDLIETTDDPHSQLRMLATNKCNDITENLNRILRAHSHSADPTEVTGGD